MAGRLFSVTTGSTALVAATAKTVIELATGAGVTNSWAEFDVCFNGVTATAIPVLCELVRYTATGTGTVYTPNKVSGAQDVAAATTAKINDTVEPSTPTILAAYFIPPTSGLTLPFILNPPVGMINSQFQGIRLTAPAIVNYVVNLWFCE
jgi:hypothetical protein